MEQRRWLLFLLLSFIIIEFFTIMMHRNAPKQPARTVSSPGSTTSTLAGDLRESTATLPIEGALTTPTVVVAEVPRTIENTSLTIAQHPGELIPIKTSKYNALVDTVGAVFHSIRLLDPGSESFVLSGETSQGIELVRRIPGSRPELVTQNWPLEVTFKEANVRSYEDFNNVRWEVTSKRGEEKGDLRIVQLASPTIQDVRLQKIISVPDNNYLSNLKVTVFNDSESTISVTDELNRGLTLRWGPGLVERDFREAGTAGDAAYDSAVVKTEEKVLSFRPAPDKEPKEWDGKIHWAGVESKFFAALLIPYQPDDAAKLRHYFFRTLVPAAHKYEAKGYSAPLTMELSTDKFEVAPRSNYTFEFSLYMGPKKARILSQPKMGLQSLMFHNAFWYMRPIYLFLTDALNFIEKFVSNYGIAIILLTVIVRLAMFPLTQKQIKIQAKTMFEMQKIKPYLDEINQKYKDNPQEKQKQIMKVYREHNVNPFATLRGCLPLLLQMPIFIGLYRVCSDTIDLQGAHFLWVKDLSVADRLFTIGNLPLLPHYFNLLPLLMAGTQLIASWVSMARATNMDPTQKQVMYFMPLIFMFTLYNLPAGLMVYWIASNIWTIFQTMITNRMMAKEEAKHREAAGVAAPVLAAPSGVSKPRKRK